MTPRDPEPLGPEEEAAIRMQDERLKWEGTTIERLVPVPQFATLRREAYPSEIEIHRLLAALDAERAGAGRLRERWAKWIAESADPAHDWACAECVPHSECLVDGFQCVYHEARAAALDAEPGQPT